MTNSLKALLASSALALALAGCASAPEPSQRLIAAEASVLQAKTDPAMAEAGRAAIEQAGIALANARVNHENRKNDDFIHFLRMGEGYVALAEARGSQHVANARIQSLNMERAEVVSEARRRELASARADTQVAQQRADRSDRVAESERLAGAASDARRIAAEAQVSDLSKELEGYEQKQTELGLTLIVRDLQFASDSAVLTAGAQGRLVPLATFLGNRPDTRIRIAGHTDSQGADAYNQALSARRAASVGSYLVSSGTNAARIETVGLGETVPLSSNTTAAGRAINRRVEITILDQTK
jgi:outer membrane protein OmpA-like peptidoglycan-associated protein